MTVLKLFMMNFYNNVYNQDSFLEKFYCAIFFFKTNLIIIIVYSGTQSETKLDFDFAQNELMLNEFDSLGGKVFCFTRNQINILIPRNLLKIWNII